MFSAIPRNSQHLPHYFNYNDLPTEIISCIFIEFCSNANSHDMFFGFNLVSKKMNATSKNDAAWMEILRRNFPYIYFNKPITTDFTNCFSFAYNEIKSIYILKNKIKEFRNYPSIPNQLQNLVIDLRKAPAVELIAIRPIIVSP